MYMANKRDDAALLLNQALNLIEAIDLKNCDCPRAKAIVITKIEEALMWLRYQGRQVPREGSIKNE